MVKGHGSKRVQYYSTNKESNFFDWISDWHIHSIYMYIFNQIPTVFGLLSTCKMRIWKMHNIIFTHPCWRVSCSVTPHLRSISSTLTSLFLAQFLISGNTNLVRTSLSPCISRKVDDMNIRATLHLWISYK